MVKQYVYPLHRRRLPHHVGDKAKNLQILHKKGFPIPSGYAISWHLQEAYCENNEQFPDAFLTTLERVIDPTVTYAVRSSANVEDAQSQSFAGQFKSVLDVQGVNKILKAVQLIWDTAQSSSIQSYLEQKGFSAQDIKMAVIVQEMISAEVSGVVFSKNPYTGLDEVLVEAVRGSGEALVQDGVTPQRWVNKWGTWTSTPDHPSESQEIPFSLIEDVVRQAKEIAKAFGRPVDLEWVYDGNGIKWVQVREITTLDIPVYSNRLSNEVFPGLIKPLVWSVNVPIVNQAWMTMFTELIGPNDIQPESLAGRFYSRAYFNMAAVGQIFQLMGLPGESLELLMGIGVDGPDRPTFKPSTKTYALLPRMLRFGWDKIRFARKIETFLPAIKQQFQAFERQQNQDLSPIQLLENIDRLAPLVKETAYYNTVVAVLMRIYNGLLKGQFNHLGLDYESFDLTGDYEELQEFDPSPHLAQLNKVFLSLDEELQARVCASGYAQLSTVSGTEALHNGIEQFIKRFGHLSDSSSDFTRTPWRENPDLILKMVTEYVPPAIGSPDRIQFADLEVPVLRYPFLKFLYHRARRFHWYREAISSVYTYGYGLFRNLFRPLGQQFTRRGVVEQMDDIFYLYVDEVREIVYADELARDYLELVRERKDEIERMKDVIPLDTIFGQQAPALEPNKGRELIGTPTSRGAYTGPVRVLRGLEDIDKLQEGDVLVIPYSDVGWTPLFAKAGAVIAESGGILSHSSIIAREYGIPAVVSVPGACRLADDTSVTVDGHTGKIAVHEAV